MKYALFPILLISLLMIGGSATVIGQTSLPDITVVEAGIQDLDHNAITGSIEISEQFNIYWTVKNLGDIASWKYGTRLYTPQGLKWLNAPSYFYTNDEYIDFRIEKEDDNLEPEQSNDWYLNWPCYFLKEGSYEFRFVVNFHRMVEESNYDNNEVAFTVNVGEAETTTKITYSTASAVLSTPSTSKTTETMMVTTTNVVVSTETVSISTGLPLPTEILYAVIAVVVLAAFGGAFFLMRKRGTKASAIPPSTIPEEYKYCQKCGTRLELDMKFCRKCGSEQA